MHSSIKTISKRIFNKGPKWIFFLHLKKKKSHGHTELQASNTTTTHFSKVNSRWTRSRHFLLQHTGPTFIHHISLYNWGKLPINPFSISRMTHSPTSPQWDGKSALYIYIYKPASINFPLSKLCLELRCQQQDSKVSAHGCRLYSWTDISESIWMNIHVIRMGRGRGAFP